MEMNLVVLKRVLDSLNIPLRIESLDDRLILQKAVYLAQIAGVDLGYRYSWYVHGPYSALLTKDYYAIKDAELYGDTDDLSKRLNSPTETKLKNISPLFKVPHGKQLEQACWLELLASVHFLKKVNGYDDKSAKQLLNKEKPHVSPFYDLAKRSLLNAGLLSS